MNGFSKRRLKGFFFRINKSYDAAVETSFLSSLVEDACLYAVQKNDRVLRKESILPDKTPVYIKYWKPRKLFHRIKTLWHRTRIEVEGDQYPNFTANTLPVPDMVLCGSQRNPLCTCGIFKVGMIVTRMIEEGADLEKLLRRHARPWINKNESQRFAVLKSIAHLLHAIHKKNLIHGDYTLRNIIYSHEVLNGKYWIIDLGSGCSPAARHRLNNFHHNHDLYRMVHNLAMNGFSRAEALFFLSSYMCCEYDDNQAYDLARRSLQACLIQHDHRAVEAIRCFDQTDEYRAAFSFQSSQ